MKRGKKRSNALSSLADAVNTGVATWLTLAVRVPQLLTGTMKPAEMNRMVSEKFTATADGATAAGLAMMKLGGRRRRATTPANFVSDMGTIADAASRPARRRVKANAIRLTKPSA